MCEVEEVSSCVVVLRFESRKRGGGEKLRRKIGVENPDRVGPLYLCSRDMILISSPLFPWLFVIFKVEDIQRPSSS